MKSCGITDSIIKNNYTLPNLLKISDVEQTDIVIHTYMDKLTEIMINDEFSAAKNLEYNASLFESLHLEKDRKREFWYGYLFGLIYYCVKDLAEMEYDEVRQYVDLSNSNFYKLGDFSKMRASKFRIEAKSFVNNFVKSHYFEEQKELSYTYHNYEYINNLSDIARDKRAYQYGLLCGFAKATEIEIRGTTLSDGMEDETEEVSVMDQIIIPKDIFSKKKSNRH